MEYDKDLPCEAASSLFSISSYMSYYKVSPVWLWVCSDCGTKLCFIKHHSRQTQVVKIMAPNKIS